MRQYTGTFIFTVRKNSKICCYQSLRKKRKYRGNVRRGVDKRTTIKDPIRIDERPEEVKDRKIPGHLDNSLSLFVGVCTLCPDFLS